MAVANSSSALRSSSPGWVRVSFCCVVEEPVTFPVVAFSVLVVVYADAAAMKSVCGATIKLSIIDNIATKVILDITVLFNSY